MSEGVLIGVYGDVNNLSKELTEACRSFITLASLETGVNISDFHWKLHGSTVDQSLFTLTTVTSHLTSRIMERINLNAAINRRGYFVIIEGRHSYSVGLVDKRTFYGQCQSELLSRHGKVADKPVQKDDKAESAETKKIENWYQDLQIKLNQTEKELKEAKDTLLSEKAQSRQTENTISLLQSQISHVKRNRDELQKLLDEERLSKFKSIDLFQREIKLLKDLNNGAVNIGSIQDTLEEAEEVNHYKEEIKALKEQLANAKDQYTREADNWGVSFVKKNKEIADLTNAVSSLNVQLQRSRSTVDDLNRQIENLKNSVDEVSKIYRDDIVKKNDIIKNNDNIIKTLQNDVKVRDHTNRENVEKNALTRDKLLFAIEELKKQVEDLTMDNSDLTIALQAANDHIIKIANQENYRNSTWPPPYPKGPLEKVQFQPQKLRSSAPVPPVDPVAPVSVFNLSALTDATSQCNSDHDLKLKGLFDCFFGSCHYNIKEDIDRVNAILLAEAKKGADTVTFSVDPVHRTYRSNMITVSVVFRCKGTFYNSADTHSFFKKTLVGTEEEMEVSRTDKFMNMIRTFVSNQLGLSEFNGCISTLKWC